MNNQKELTVEQETVKDCPILFQMYSHSPKDTCMCWGWEFDRGWDDLVQTACRQLEMLNQEYYSKYRIRVQADQIKEKYGTLHFYYSVIQDPPKSIYWFGKTVNKIVDFIDRKVDFKFKEICLKKPENYDSVVEITKEDYEKAINQKYKFVNIEYKQDGDKYFSISHLYRNGKYTVKPTKHKFLYKIQKILTRIRNELLFIKKDNKESRNCFAYVETKAEEIIEKCEHDCNNTCEICGCQIGNSWSPVCVTEGYIRYLCKSCADKSGDVYHIHGDDKQ